jgi:hypothetical protein
VPDRLDLGAVPDDACLLAGQQGEHPLDRDLVLQDLRGLLHRGPPGRLVTEDRRPPDVLDEPFREGVVASRRRGGLVRVHELELDR